MKKFFLITFCIVLLGSQALASTFGSFPYQQQKNSGDLSVSYQIGLMNIGENRLKVKLDAEDTKEFNVSFSRNSFTLESGRVTKDPEGSGWFHLGEGRYVQVEKVNVEVDISRYRKDNSLEIPVTVTAEPVGEGSTGIGSRILRVREHSFRAELDPRLRPRKRPGNEKEEKEEEKYWQEDRDIYDKEQDFNLEQKKSNVERRGDENRSKMRQNETRVSRNKRKNGVNSLTYIFLLGTVASVLYIYRSI